MASDPLSDAAVRSSPRGRPVPIRAWAARARASSASGAVDRDRQSDGAAASGLVLEFRLRGTGSGAAADTPFGVVTELEHGLGRRQFFWTGNQSSALDAVGLRD